MEKDFDQWNNLKQSIDAQEIPDGPFPTEGWVWMCSFGINIGREQNGGIGKGFSRPGAVIKKFNNEMYWVVPLSTKQKSLDFYYNFTDPHGEAVSAVIAQLRLMSIKRFVRDMYRMEDFHMYNIRAQIKSFL